MTLRDLGNAVVIFIQLHAVILEVLNCRVKYDSYTKKKIILAFEFYKGK